MLRTTHNPNLGIADDRQHPPPAVRIDTFRIEWFDVFS